MRISIRSFYSDGVFRIVVEDNGKGIPPDVIEAVKADKVISRWA
jgi:signal transduction histidine kinase